MNEGTFKPENFEKKEQENVGMIKEVRDYFLEKQRLALKAKSERREYDEKIAHIRASSIGVSEADLWRRITGVSSPVECQSADKTFMEYRQNLSAEILQLEKEGKTEEAERLREGKGVFADVVGKEMVLLVAKYEGDVFRENGKNAL
jgi:hypothetical protein